MGKGVKRSIRQLIKSEIRGGYLLRSVKMSEFGSKFVRSQQETGLV